MIVTERWFDHYEKFPCKIKIKDPAKHGWIQDFFQGGRGGDFLRSYIQAGR